MKFLRKLISLGFVLFSLMSLAQAKMNGVSLVSPPKFSEEYSLASVSSINANWVAIIPFSFCNSESPKVYFNSKRQWWGERKEGIVKLIELAKKQQLNIFLKPHVWYRNGWIGDFNLTTEADWQIWEKDYTEYILSYAKIAETHKVPLFCVGTELKKVTQNRPLFFKQLILKVRQVYKGKITYAANWDNVQAVNFWKELDYIGVDAYYSLSDEKQPEVQALISAWKPIKQHLQDLSHQHKKPILFAEYGYESCDYNTKETWGSKNKTPVNEQAQVNAYKALYQSFYNESWFAGGFLWKWHITNRTMRNKAKAFTPQGKKVEQVIKAQFKKHDD